MASYITKYLARDEYGQWDELVSQSPACNIFDTTLWLDALSSIPDCNIKILGVFNKGDLIGGVAFNVIKRFGMKIACVPPLSFYNSCHYIPIKTQYKDRLGNFIQDILNSITLRLQEDFHYIIIENHPELKDIRSFVWNNWDQNVLYTYGIDLNKLDFSLISPSKRGWIKKAQKNMIITEEIKDVIPVYDILRQTYIRMNMQFPLTLNVLSEICKKIHSHISIRTTVRNGIYNAVNIAVIDYKKSCIYNLFNGYKPENPGSGANSFLLCETMEYFKNNGFKFFDFGPAGTQSKARFKSEFCAGLFPYYRVSKSNSLKFTIAWHLTKGRILQNQ